MNFKYRLPEVWIDKIASMEEFANGATQVTILLNDGQEFHRALISDSANIIAIRGFDELPFQISDIKEILQSAEDKSPRERGGWRYWDDWRV